MDNEKVNRGVLFTYTGKISFPDMAPSLLDIAVSLSREGRYAGAGMRFWPVALHNFVVADLLPHYLRFDGLNHDNPEVITGDTPKPAKTAEISAFEHQLQSGIYKSFKVSMPTDTDYALIKEADRRVFRGEVYTVGTRALQEFNERDEEAEELILNYVRTYTYSDMLEAGGLVPIEFMRRWRVYYDMLPDFRRL